MPWSIANISNVPVDEYYKAVASQDNLYRPLNHADLENYIKKSGARVIQRKGATYYAIALSACHIVKCLVEGMDTTLTVSSMMHGEYGVEDVCLSTLNIVGRDGLRGKLLPTLTAEEKDALHHSADSLREVISGLTI